MSEPTHRLFGRIAVEETDLTEDELEECLKEQKIELEENNEARKIGQIIVDKGYLTNSQIQDLLQKQKTLGNRRFGETAMELHFITFDQLQIACTIQNNLRKNNSSPPIYGQPLQVYEELLEQQDESSDSAPPIGDILKRLGYLTKEEIDKVLEAQSPAGSEQLYPCPNCESELDLLGFDPGTKMICGSCSKELYVHSRGESKVLNVQKPESKEPTKEEEPESEKSSSEEIDDTDQDRREDEQKEMEEELEDYAEQMEALEGQMLEDFWLEKMIGRDSTGAIFRAYEVAKERNIALKLYQQESTVTNTKSIKRMIQNAKKLSIQNCPNLRQIYRIGQMKGFRFVAMEWLEGESLFNLLQRDGTVSYGRALSIMLGVTEALKVSSNQNVYHGDIRPSHIMIEKDGRVKLCNLGLADDAVENIRELVEYGDPVSIHLAPELAVKNASPGILSDMFSVGSCFYHMIIGTPPVKGHYPFEALIRTMDDGLLPPHKINPNVPEQLSNTIMKLLSPAPKRRYSDYESLQEDLQESQEELEGLSTAAPPEVEEEDQEESIDIPEESPEPELVEAESGTQTQTQPPEEPQDQPQWKNRIKQVTSSADLSNSIILGLVIIGGISLFVGAAFFFPGGKPEWKKDYDNLVSGTNFHQLEQIKQGARSLKDRYPNEQKLHNQLDQYLKKQKEKWQEKLREEFEEYKRELNSAFREHRYSELPTISEEYRDSFKNNKFKSKFQNLKQEFQTKIKNQWDKQKSEVQDLLKQNEFGKAKERLDNIQDHFEETEWEEPLQKLLSKVEDEAEKHRRKQAKQNVLKFIKEQKQAYRQTKKTTQSLIRSFQFQKAEEKLVSQKETFLEKRTDVESSLVYLPQEEGSKPIKKISSALESDITIAQLIAQAWKQLVNQVQRRINGELSISLRTKNGKNGKVQNVQPGQLTIKFEESDPETVSWNEIAPESLSVLIQNVDLNNLKEQALLGLTKILSDQNQLFSAYQCLKLLRDGEDITALVKQEVFEQITSNFQRKLKQDFQDQVSKLQKELKTSKVNFRFLDKLLDLREKYLKTALNEELSALQIKPEDQISSLLDSYYRNTLEIPDSKAAKTTSLLTFRDELPNILDTRKNSSSWAIEDQKLTLKKPDGILQFPWKHRILKFWIQTPAKKKTKINLRQGNNEARIQLNPKKKVSSILASGFQTNDIKNWSLKNWNRVTLERKGSNKISFSLNEEVISTFDLQHKKKEVTVKISFPDAKQSDELSSFTFDHMFFAFPLENN